MIVTYGDDQRHYAHPDHLRVHDISVPAFDRAGDPEWYPEAGEPWKPLEAVLHRVVADAGWWRCTTSSEALGLESPFGEEWLERIRRPAPDDRITTEVADRRLLRGA